MKQIEFTLRWTDKTKTRFRVKTRKGAGWTRNNFVDWRPTINHFGAVDSEAKEGNISAMLSILFQIKFFIFPPSLQKGSERKIKFAWDKQAHQLEACHNNFKTSRNSSRE